MAVLLRGLSLCPGVPIEGGQVCFYTVNRVGGCLHSGAMGGVVFIQGVPTQGVCFYSRGVTPIQRGAASIPGAPPIQREGSASILGLCISGGSP